MTTPVYDKIAVLGCGLIGSSIVRAARAHGVAGQIAVYDLSPSVRERVAELDIADLVSADPAEAVKDADLVVLAPPPGAIVPAAEACLPGLKPGATLTDVGSVKGPVGQALAALAPPGVFVVPGHPIAGTEFSGPDAGFPELFHGRWTILTPQSSEDPAYQDAVLEILARFTEDLQALSRAIRWGEADKLEELFSRTRDIRRGVIALGQESAEPNWGRDKDRS